MKKDRRSYTKEPKPCRLCDEGNLFSFYCNAGHKSVYSAVRARGEEHWLMSLLGALIRADRDHNFLRIGKGGTRDRLLEWGFIEKPSVPHHLNQFKITELGKHKFYQFTRDHLVWKEEHS